MKDSPIIKRHKKEWFDENAPFGKALGYPDCCIKEFCDQPPEVLKRNGGPSKDDKRRFKAAFQGDHYTGFIPCIKHAKEILSGKITLESLIVNRSSDIPPFPFI